MVRSYYTSEGHADYFDFERIEALKPAIEAWGISTLSETSFFFFQAEDGIRDTSVTGVQTCALPIWSTVTLAGTESSAGRTLVLPRGHAKFLPASVSDGRAGCNGGRMLDHAHVPTRTTLDRKSVV